MAEGYEGFHVPQQSRRDKLRIVTAQNHPPCLEPTINLHRFAGLLPLYDPSSLISSDLLTCASATGQDFHNHYRNQTGLLPGPAEGCRENEGCSIKEESVNLMGFAGNLMNTPPSTSSSRLHQTQHPYFELQSSLPMNPSPIQDINSNPLFNFSHTVQNPRDFNHVYSSGGEVVVFKPEPLSLSLSSHPTYQNSHQLELNLQRYVSGLYPSPIVGSMSNNISRSSVPLGPSTGYASFLKGSKFLRPAQQLLVEFCEIWCQGNDNEKLEDDSAFMDSPSDIFDDSFSSGGDGDEDRRKKSRLISMLDEVYRRYKQYYRQMQEVVASFECVSGLCYAAPYANFAITSMSKHFRCLKNAISDQLPISRKATSNYCQKYGLDSGFLDQQPVWRPQRGLPERAVAVLRAWLFEHFLHPLFSNSYPTDSDKVMLAKQTGLSRGQVSNWFINARVRLWKPMVEEIHVLETRLGQKQQHREDRTKTGNRTSDHLPSKNSLQSNDSSKSTQLFQDIPTKRARNELQNLAMANERQLNPSYNNLDPQMDSNMSIAGGNGGVSLTLGLHQNNVIDLSEPFSVNAVQRYGLGIEDKMNGDVYVMGGFEAQSRNFARGQLLHDSAGG